MTDQEFYDDEFIVMLTIDGTSYDEIEVKVTDPNKTIRDQINSIVQVFELPKMDNGGNPIQYLPADGSSASDFRAHSGISYA